MARGVKAWEVFGVIGLDGLGKTTAQLNSFNAMGVRTGQTALGLNKKMLLLAGGTAVVGGAALLAGSRAVRAFAGFDEKMTESLAIMGNVSDTMRGEMSDSARAMARQTIFSAEQAAESYFFLASAGLSAEQSVAALPQVAAFAQAGMFDMAQATDLATDAQSALGLTVDDAEQNLSNLTRVTDVLVKANTLANASVEQFATALTSGAGAALKTVNKSVEEGAAVLAAFADQGIKAEKAGNALSRVVRILTVQAVKNSEAYEKLGIRVFDAEGNLRHFADIVEDLTTALGSMSDEQRAASLEALGFRARLQGVILPLLGTSDAIRRYNAGMNQSAGVTREVADKQLQTFNKQMQLLGAEIGDTVIATGEWLDATGDLTGKIRAARTTLVFYRDIVGEIGDAWRDATGPIGEAGRMIENMGRRIPGLDLLFEIEDAEEAGFGWARAREIAAVAAEREAAAEQRLADLITERNAATLAARERFAETIIAGRNAPTLDPRVSAEQTAADQRLAETFGRPEDLTAIDLSDWENAFQERWGQAVSEGFAFAKDPEIEARYKESLRELLSPEDGEEGLAGQIVPEFRQLGADLIRGLVDGSFDTGEFLKQSFITIASNFILGPLGGFLGIASPSKVTAEMGRNLVIGLEQGIMSRVREGGVSAAWSTVLGQIETAGAGRFGGVAGRLSGPSLDLSSMPPARNPLAAARDRDWQLFLRAGLDAARADGFRE